MPEPVLRDYKNIECRDAVLAYDGEPELVRDEKGKPITRWDGESMKINPATGEEVPDESKRVPDYRYRNPRRAGWPEVDFIIGNPPFLGQQRMRRAFGDGYVDALRSANPDLPDTIDFVVYWWCYAARLLHARCVRRFGFITTNSISQSLNRKALVPFFEGDKRLHLVFAVPDHPWVDSTDGAAVRIAMTVAGPGDGTGVLLTVSNETKSADAELPSFQCSARSGAINPALDLGANLGGMMHLRANHGIAIKGFELGSQGFLLDSSVAERWLREDCALSAVLRPYVTGNDLKRGQCTRYVVDFERRPESEARRYARVYQYVTDRVRADRAGNRETRTAAKWWLFRRAGTDLRLALNGVDRFIATTRTAKYRVFQFLEGRTVAESTIVVIACADAFVLGVLSSRLHVVFATMAGGHLGVGNDPRYHHESTFNPFPFPNADETRLQSLRALAEELDAHRKRQQGAHPDLTITDMYNVLERLRSGEMLTAKEKVIHEHGLVSVLKKLHDDLDAAVFDAYGWPHDLTDEQILERLVALNAERAAEERRGLVRWLRPEFQNPGGVKLATQEKLGMEEEPEEAAATPAAAVTAWPRKLAEQVAAVRDVVTTGTAEWSVAEVAAAFKRAKKTDVAEVLDSLAALGHLVGYESPTGRRWKRGRV